MRSKIVAEQVFRVLEPEHLKNAGGTVADSIVYFALRKCLQENGDVPDDAALTIELNTFCSKYQSARPEVAEELEDMLPAFLSFRKMVTDQSVGLAMRVMQSIATKFIHRPAVAEVLSEALATEAVSGIAKKLVDLEAKFTAAAGKASVNNVSTIDLGESGSRVTTGVPWLDARLGGGNGPVLGAVLGIIAPQGHGKTLQGIQLGVAQALMQRHAVLILAEEGLSKAVRRRILSCATDIPSTDLEAAKDDPIAAMGDRNPLLIKERVAAVDKYLHIVDLVNKPGDLETGMNEIYKLQHAGTPPTYVYFDWAGPLARRMVSTGFRGQQFKGPYDALKELAFQLAMLAAQSNTIVAVSHQMSAAQVKKGWFAEADQYCAMDCNTFTEMFKYVLVINPRHAATGLSWLTIAKSRDDPHVKRLIIKMRGDISKMYDVTNDYEPNPTKGKGFKMKQQKPAVPKE